MDCPKKIFGELLSQAGDGMFEQHHNWCDHFIERKRSFLILVRVYFYIYAIHININPSGLLFKLLSVVIQYRFANRLNLHSLDL